MEGEGGKEGRFQVSSESFSREICEGDGRRIFHVVRDLRKDEIKMTIS